MNYEDILIKLKNKNWITKKGMVNPKLSFIFDELLFQEVEKITNFLDSDVSIRERLTCIINNISTRQICPVCLVEKRTFIGSKQKPYSDFCSLICKGKSENVKNKVKKTNLEKYSVENPFQNNKIKEKIKQTNLEKYGVEFITQNSFIQGKMKNTFLEKYGVENPFQNNEIKEKIKQTNLEKYGVEHVFQNEDVKKKFKQTNLEKYGVEYPLLNEQIKNKAKLTNIEKYGVEYPNQSHISKEVLININDPMWLKYQHHDLKKPLSQIAKELGISGFAVGNHIKKYNIEVKYFNASSIENVICDYITFISDYNIERRFKLNGVELDIFLPELNLAFEINGIYWHSEKQGKDKNYHLNKTKLCEENNIRLVHIFENEWEFKQEIVKSRISNLLNKNKRIFARKCKIRKLKAKEYSLFFKSTHIQGSAPASACYGLFYNNELVAAMSFGKSRYNKNVEWELIRYSNKLFTNVVGGASRLFKYFIKEHNPKSIISYSDKRWNTGNLYKQLGFEHKHDSAPNYFYFHKNNCLELFPRIKFQKHKLKNSLELFNPNLTEYENMVNNGYDRIWDCGNSVWVL